MLTYYFCYKKSKQKPNKLKRENTPYPKQSVIDIDNGSIDQVTSKFDNIEYEYLNSAGILHVYKTTKFII